MRALCSPWQLAPMIKRAKWAKWSFPPSSSSSPIHSLPALSSPPPSRAQSVSRGREKTRLGSHMYRVVQQDLTKCCCGVFLSQGNIQYVAPLPHCVAEYDFLIPILPNHPVHPVGVRVTACSGGRSEIFLLFTPEKRVNFRLPLPPPLFAQGLIAHAHACSTFLSVDKLKFFDPLIFQVLWAF